jgi:hypothetical protein
MGMDATHDGLQWPDGQAVTVTVGRDRDRASCRDLSPQQSHHEHGGYSSVRQAYTGTGTTTEITCDDPSQRIRRIRGGNRC